MSAYTRLLWHGLVTQAEVRTNLVVPAGRVWVLRDLELNIDTGISTFRMALTSEVLHAALDASAAPGFGHWQWQGRIAVPAGMQVSMWASGPNTVATLTGYDLQA